MTSHEMARAAVIEIVAVDACDDDMLQAKLAPPRTRRYQAGSCASSASGLPVLTLQNEQARVQSVADDHEGGVLLVPALADVRTTCFFADRVELQIAHQFFGLVVAQAGWRLDPDPVGLTWAGIVRPALLFRVARAVWVASLAQINQRSHAPNMSLRALSRNAWTANLPCVAKYLMTPSLVRPQSDR
jgi:hypothetical protein